MAGGGCLMVTTRTFVLLCEQPSNFHSPAYASLHKCTRVSLKSRPAFLASLLLNDC